MAYQALFYERRKGNPDRGYFFLRDDVYGWKRFKHKSPVYQFDDEGKYTTLFGEKCSKIEGPYDYYDPHILEKDITKEVALLRDFYYKEDKIPTKHNIVILDIEIKIMGSLTPSYIQLAPAPLTAIALIDINSKQKICFIVDDHKVINEIEEDGKIIIPCYSERDLINKFLKKWKELDPTICVGWNSDFFDMPYLYCRIINVFGVETANLLSPLKKVINHPSNPNNPITIAGVACLDYMLLCKKYFQKEEPSYALGKIGEKYADLPKIEYEGNLDDLFKVDPHKYIEYNIRDVEIIEVLEEKLQFLKLTILISHLCHTPYESIYYNTVLNEGAILTYLKRRNIISHNKPTTINPSIKQLNVGDIVVHQRGTPTVEGEIIDIRDGFVEIRTKSGESRVREEKTVRKHQSYAGGFLLDPKPGVYRWLSDYDYASLYPSIIRSLNLGIETLFGRLIIPNATRNLWWGLSDLKLKDPNQEIGIEILDINTYEFKENKTTIGKIIDFIENKNMNISANGVIFRTDKTSIVSEVLSDWFNLRVEYKDKMKQSYKSGNSDLGDLYNSQQHSLKILLNAVYGGFAINSWRFTDGFKVLSSAITCTGQRMIIETIGYANKVIEENYLGNEFDDYKKY